MASCAPVKALSEHDRRLGRAIQAFSAACVAAVVVLAFVTERITLYLLLFAALAIGQAAIFRRADDQPALRLAMAPSGRTLLYLGVAGMLFSGALYLASSS